MVYRGSEAPLLIVVVTLGIFFVRFQLSEKALIEGGGVIAWLGVRARRRWRNEDEFSGAPFAIHPTPSFKLVR